MKNKYSRLILLSLGMFALTIPATLAQSLHDYVITQKNDTISCNLESQLFGLPKYKALNSEVLIKINPDSIKEFCFHGKVNPQVSVKLGTDGDKRFLARLEYGAICLYELSVNTTTTSGGSPGMGGMGTTSTSNKTEWYAAKKGDDVVNIIKNNQLISFGSSKKQRKKNLADLLADNPGLLKEFTDKDEYGFDDIRNVIQVYNSNVREKK